MQSSRSLPALALFAAVVAAPVVQAQTNPSEPPSAPVAQAPAIGALAAPANPFPPVDKAAFTATIPDADTVSAFVKRLIGYDPKRIWQVQAIAKTQAPGVAKILVLVNETGKTAQDAQPFQFFTLDDGKYALINDVMPFGTNPYAEARKTLMERANGPSQGAASKETLFVEFADFQCPHCKAAQDTIEKLLKDYPNAHFVYQNFPLTQIHSEAFKAAAYSLCVAKAGGNTKFFEYAKAVYEHQEALTPDGSDLTLRDAVVKIGLDPTPIAACAASADTAKLVNDDIKLAQDLGVSGTPTLYINGRPLSIAQAPYSIIKQVIDNEIALDAAK